MAAHNEANSGKQTEANVHDGAHHGWSPDIDEEHQEPNPSAERSFDPDRYAPEPGPEPPTAAEEHTGTGSKVGESVGRRGEDIADQDQPGHHDEGPRGTSQRPSGSKDARAYTGIDPDTSE
ncbi:hypothetical protein [Streptacidiphilus neutrinimicus]|uniref:hypothetical protein n=1 Tax=Streptacidiphilus neutrinimicus TaxID=105420 RepID=UPI0005A9A06D|nr:hypothetical protein [Streptacidiphilus neutrinimicus]